MKGLKHMGNFITELNENVVPVVRATKMEILYLDNMISDVSNIDDVIERLKGMSQFDRFLIRNFYDRDGEFDELKLKSWVKNSFSTRTFYSGESTIEYIFDDSDLDDGHCIDVGDFVDDSYLKSTYLSYHEYSRSGDVYITDVTRSLAFDREKSKDTLIIIDDKVGE